MDREAYFKMQLLCKECFRILKFQGKEAMRWLKLPIKR